MIKCFDIAQMVFDIANDGSAKNKTINEINMKSFQKTCGMIDSLVSRFGGSKIDIEIDKKTNDIITTIECEDFEVLSITDDFYSVIKFSKHFGFKPADEIECGVKVWFVFDSVWR